ncbi:MAG: potassium/proton antiporter [Victivallaceae bacterium]|nr:potassium/proton antiporter [Victivallaceae bacterium]
MNILAEIPPVLGVMGILLIIGIVSTRISSHFNVPTLLLFLGLGMVVGYRYEATTNFIGIANFIGTVAMCYILFSGGMDTSFRSIKSQMLPGGLLATLGVMITAAVMGGATMLLFPHWDWRFAMLLGCVVSSTDAAAVFSILSGRGISLKNNLKPLLELESGSNDPMAYFLTLFFLTMITDGDSASSFWMLVPTMVLKLGVGVLVGWLSGLAGRWMFNRSELDYEGLYLVMGIGLVLIAYGVAEVAFGNGFMSVYVCGMTMGSLKFARKKALSRFHEGIAWLMQVIMFLMLGLMVTPQMLRGVAVYGLPLAAILVLVARPVAVFACLILPGCHFKWREMLLVSWVGLRGAAPIVLATFPLVYGLDNAGMLFHVVFFIVILSVLVQGRGLMPVARFLKLQRPSAHRRRLPLELDDSAGMNNEMYEFSVEPDSPLVGKTLAELCFPNGALVLLIRRSSGFVLPRGNTVIEVGDGVVVMADSATLGKLAVECFHDREFEGLN